MDKATEKRLMNIRARVSASRERNPDDMVLMDRLELDWILDVALVSNSEPLVPECTPVEGNIFIVVQDNGVDSDQLRGFVTQAGRPLAEAFIAGWNGANRRNMDGNLNMVEVTEFDPSEMDDD